MPLSIIENIKFYSWVNAFKILKLRNFFQYISNSTYCALEEYIYFFLDRNVTFARFQCVSLYIIIFF